MTAVHAAGVGMSKSSVSEVMVPGMEPMSWRRRRVAVMVVAACAPAARRTALARRSMFADGACSKWQGE